MAIQGIQSLIRCNDRLTILHPSRINIAGWMTSGSLHNSLYQQVKETCRYYEYCIGSTANGIMEHVFNCRVLGNTSFWRRRIHVSFIRRRFQTCQLDIYQVYRVMCRVFEIPSLCVEVGKFNLKTQPKDHHPSQRLPHIETIKECVRPMRQNCRTTMICARGQCLIYSINQMLFTGYFQSEHLALLLISMQ